MKSAQLLHSGEVRVNFSSSIVFLLATSPKIIEKHLPTFLSPFPPIAATGLRGRRSHSSICRVGWGG